MRRINTVAALAKFQQAKLRGYIGAMIRKENPKVTKGDLVHLVTWQMNQKQAKWLADYTAAKKAKAALKRAAKKAAR